MDEPRARQPPLRSPLLQHPIAVGFAILVLAGLLGFLWTAVAVLLLGFFAVLAATLLSYPIDWLSHFLPRAVALIITILLVLGTFTVLGILIVPVVNAEAGRLATAVPVALSRLEAWWAHFQSEGPLPSLPPAQSLASRIVSEVTSLAGHAVPFALGVGSIVITAFILFVLALFLAYAPHAYVGALRVLCPREHEPVFDETVRRLGHTLRRWTAGILMSMVFMGTFAAVGLYIAGIDGWFLLGFLTFLGTFVPYAGALASAVPGLLVGLAQSPLHMLYAAIVYAAVHLAEGYLVSPFIMRHTVLIRPAFLLFWQLLMAAAFGVVGVMVATPLLACAQVAVGYLYVERRLGKGHETLKPPA